jgi:signal transduction histidine kinase/CheY-like chemotaxis protein
MFDAFYCIGKQHNLALVALAAIICLVATSTSLRLLLMARSKPRRDQARWLIGSAACAGTGTWATHFIAMLAYDPGFSTAYDPVVTLASLAIAIAFGGGCIFAVVRSRWPWSVVAGSALFSLGVGAMHYTGMWALKTPGTLSWRPSFVAASFILAALFFAGASQLLMRRAPTRAVRFAASGLLTVGICSLHFTGMAGVSIMPDPTIVVPPSLLPHDVLALLVGASAALILLAFLATSVLEARSKTASLRLLQSVVEFMPQGFAYYDHDDRLALCNDAFRRELGMLGLEPGIGTPYREILGNVARDHALAEVGDRVRGQTSAHDAADFHRELADGRVLRVEQRRTSDGGRMTVFSDVTALVRESEELAAALEAAESGMRAKSEFLANMSHELRTPMNGVLGAADLLAAEPLTAGQAELVEVVRSSGQSLNRMLCDILNLAKIDAGTFDMVDAPYDLRGALDETLTPFLRDAEAKGLALRWATALDVPERLVGDVSWFRQILGNLVSNAIKFTEVGGVDVAVRQDGDLLCVIVRDTGIGIEPAMRKRLFGRFEQADGSPTRRYGGAGLGLAVAREFATRMNGALRCESAPGRGSTFILALPLHAEYVAGDPAPATSVEPSEGASILVVDDNPTNRRVLALILEGAGIQTAFAENGQAGVEAWRKTAPDAVLMDIQMPVMDGLTAIQTIRGLERSEGREHTPIIVVSANAMPEDVAASAAAGADAHLGKPVDAAALFNVLEQVEHHRAAA